MNSKEKFLKKCKEEHLCVWCGKPLDCNSKSFCQICLDKHRKDYHKSKNGCDWHDCETCPHNECIADEDLIDEFSNNRIKYSKNYYEKRKKLDKENNLCRMCHKEKPVEGKKTCQACLDKDKKRYYEKKRSTFLENYHTVFHDSNECCKCHEPIYKGKLCKKHYDICLNNLSKIKYHNTPWKNDNLFKKIFSK